MSTGSLFLTEKEIERLTDRHQAMGAKYMKYLMLNPGIFIGMKIVSKKISKRLTKHAL
jgi:hypothetical protein